MSFVLFMELLRIPVAHHTDTGMTHWVAVINRIILTICEHISAEHIGDIGRCESIRIQEAADLGIVVAAVEVVETGLGIVIVAAIAEWICRADAVAACIRHAAFAPCVVFIGRYYLARRRVGQSHYVALQIIQIVCSDAPLLNAHSCSRAVIEEPHYVAAGLLRKYLRAVEQVFGFRTVDGLAVPYPVRRVGITQQTEYIKCDILRLFLCRS